MLEGNTGEDLPHGLKWPPGQSEEEEEEKAVWADCKGVESLARKVVLEELAAGMARSQGTVAGKGIEDNGKWERLWGAGREKGLACDRRLSRKGETIIRPKRDRDKREVQGQKIVWKHWNSSFSRGWSWTWISSAVSKLLSNQMAECRPGSAGAEGAEQPPLHP